MSSLRAHAAETEAPLPHPIQLDCARPARPIILIGTAETVAVAREQIGLVEGGPEPIACILVEGDRRARAAGGLPVAGGLDDIPATIARLQPELALVSIPGAFADAAVRVRAALRRAGVPERVLPPLAELLAPPLSSTDVVTPAPSPAARLDYAELIGRTPHSIDGATVGAILRGKRVLITGAGGSIGAELARVAAAYAPAELQLMDRSENALFEVDRVIARVAPGLQRRTLLHDVIDADQTLSILLDLRPHVVFHAAAHKHVPLMEDHPAHAITNNVFGTKAIADAAASVGAERFVFVSTDKAVNPTSVMGATKRLAELYIHWVHEASRRLANPGETPTRFSIVRFGNVLGSACSVLTIWSAQIAEGGPITVTDPEMTRFFMTIPEAAALVAQSAALPLRAAGPDPQSSSASVYVLDMGGPVRILDLAERFIRAHGLEPRDPVRSDSCGARPGIDIAFTGVRPGEKLYEELSYPAEALRPTAHPGINAWAGPAPRGNCAAMIADLGQVRASRDREAVLAAIRRHVPEMARP